MRTRNQHPVTSRFLAVLFALIGLLLHGCGGGGGGGGGSSGEPATLVSLQLVPPNPSVALGFQRSMVATGIYSDSTTRDLTGVVQWNVDDAAIAAIDGAGASAGLVRSIAVGSSRITATDPTTGIAATTSLAITPAVLVGIDLDPPTASLPVGYTRNFRAIGRFSDSTTQNLTDVVSWSSTDATVAAVGNQIGSFGNARGVATGSTSIRASHSASGVRGSATLSVTPAVLVSIDVTPGTASLALGYQQQFTATGTFSDNSTQDLTTAVTWASSTPATAAIGNATSPGLATSVAVGSTTITATDANSGVIGTTILSVTPALLLSVAVTPTSAAIALGYTQQFTAIGTFSDNTTQDLTEVVTWSSANETAATISNAAGSRGLATTAAVGSTTITATEPVSGAAGATQFTVDAAVLVAIDITPTLPSVALGYGVQFTATGTFSDNTTQDLTAAVTWSSTQPTVASISVASGNEGRATSASVGSTTIQAVVPGTDLVGSTTLTVTPAVLVSLGVTPSLPSVALGYDVQFTATGTFSDNTTQDLTADVTWDSSTTTVAVIGNASGNHGRAGTLATGTTTITATAPGTTITDSTALQVTPAVLETIAVTPDASSIALGYQRQFTAIGTFSDHSTQDLTTAVTWSSSATAVATIDNAGGSQGLATTLAVGTTDVRAVEPGSGIAGATTLTVQPAVLVSLTVTPSAPQLVLGYGLQFTAIGTFSDNTTQDLTAAVTWSSDTPPVATIGNASGSEGLCRSVAVGTTTIRASSGGVSDSTTLSVQPAVLVAVEVTPTAPQLALGYLRQFTATGRFSDDTTIDLTEVVTWSSSTTATATISNAAGSHGLATSAAVGTTTMTATHAASGLAGGSTLTVTPAVLVTIDVTPGNAQLALGYQQQFTATGTFSDNTTQDLTAAVTWSSSQPGCTTIDNSVGNQGLASTVTTGATTITATEPGSGLAGATPFTVTPAVLVAIDITPGSASLALGYQQSFTATGTFSDNTTQDLTTTVTWSSSQTAAATIDNAPGSQGLVTTIAPGTTTLTATDPTAGIAGATSLTVTPAVLVSLAVTPNSAAVALGYGQQYVATGTFSDNTTQDLTAAVTWTSSAEPVATISNASTSPGLATSLAVGSTTITATDPTSGLATGTNLNVTAAVLVTLAIAPAAPSVALGYQRQFTVTGTFSDNTTRDLTSVALWQSSASAVATIGNAPGNHGLATSAAVGSTTISATDPTSGVVGTTVMTVTPAVLVTVTVTPLNTSLTLGYSRQFVAAGVFSDNSTQDLTDLVTWSSSTPAVAAISNAAGSRGLASSAGTGTTTIVAIDPASSIAGATTLQVTAAVLVALTVTPANVSIATGFTQQFTALGTYSDNSTQDLTGEVGWTSSNTAAATISAGGLASGLAAGNTQIGALHSASGLAATTTLVVGNGIVHRQTTTQSRGNGLLSITLTTPPRTATGDLMLATIAVRGGTPVVNAPGGWTLVRRSNTSSSAANANSLLVYRRIAAAGEPNTQTWTFSASQGAVGCISTFQGVNTTTPVEVSGARTTASSLSHATPSVTTLTANTLVVTCHALGSNATWTPPTGMNEIADFSVGAPNTAGGISLGISWQSQAAIAATGARTATAASNAAIGNAAIFVLRD